MTDFDTKPKREMRKRSPLRRAMLTFAAALIALTIIVIGSLLIRGTLRPFIPSIATPTLSSMRISGAGQIAYIESYVFRYTQVPGIETVTGRSVINVMNADGSNKTRLPMDSSLDEKERNRRVQSLLGWSPNNKQLLFTTDKELFVINSDGSGETKLASSTSPMLMSAVWSRDGRSITFMKTTRAGVISSFSLFTINVDGSAESPLKNIVLKNPVVVEGLPRLSPDGEKIAFVSKNDIVRTLYVVSADAADSIKLAERFQIVDFSWSPNGKHIAFASLDDLNSEIYAKHSKGIITGTAPPLIRHIYIVDIDKRSLKPITRNWADSYPAWSPDGQRIAFVSQRFGSNANSQPSAIYSVRIDGSDEIQLTDPGKYLYIIW